jgi:replication factor A1
MERKVIAQFKIPEEFLLRQKNPIKAAKSVDMTERYAIKKEKSVKSFQIKDLRVGMKRVSLEAKVLEVSEPKAVITRFGNCASVANALVSDETGKIRLCLWNDQISHVAVGDIVQIENATISQFKNERQLRVGKNGVLRTA